MRDRNNAGRIVTALGSPKPERTLGPIPDSSAGHPSPFLDRPVPDGRLLCRRLFGARGVRPPFPEYRAAFDADPGNFFLLDPTLTIVGATDAF
jgi:hypothetical protein